MRPDIDDIMKLLEDSSLIGYDSSIQNYKVQNFIIKYVEQKVDQALKNKLNRVLASHYCSLISEVKLKISNESADIEDLFNVLEKYEKNIMACLKNLMKINKTKKNRKSKKTRKTFKDEIMMDKLINSDYSEIISRRQTTVLKKTQT